MKKTSSDATAPHKGKAASVLNRMAQAALTLVLPFLVLLLDPVEAADRPTSSQIEAAEPLEGLRQFIERKDARIRQLEVELNRLREQCASANSESTFDTEIVAGQPQVAYSQADVCYRGCPFSDLGKAVLAASPGDTLVLAPEINGSCAVINKPLRIVGAKGAAGARAHLVGGVCMGKAPLVVKSEGVTIEGLEISGVSVPSRNGSCIRFDPGAENIVLRDIYCHQSEDGLLGQVKGSLLIENSRFERNGFNNGQAHGMYVWGDRLIIRNSQILATRHGGHSLKAKARSMLIEDSILAALGARNSRGIDAFGGGELILKRNVIQQGPNSDNNEIIGVAHEARRLFPNGHSVKIENNWFIFDDPNRNNRRVIAGRKLGPWVIRNNVFVGLTEHGGKFDEDVDNIWFPDRASASLPPWDSTLNSLPKPGTQPPIKTQPQSKGRP